MSGAKFSLMSRASLASMARAVLGGDAGDPPAGDPPAGTPAPSEDPAKTDAPSDEPKGGDGKTEEKSDAGTPTEQSQTETPSDAGAGAAEQSAAAPAGAQVVAAEDAAAVAAEQYRAGRAAEIKRTSDVFASAEGQANPMQAAWLLAHGPDATAESIVTSLKSFPGAKPDASAAAPSQVIADTNVDLGRGNAQAALDAGGNTPAADDAWAESDKRVGAIPGAKSAAYGGGGLITTYGSNPSAPRRSGN